jgi:hypothetical protein
VFAALTTSAHEEDEVEEAPVHVAMGSHVHWDFQQFDGGSVCVTYNTENRWCTAHMAWEWAMWVGQE